MIAVYVIAAWVALQAAGLALPAMDLDARAIRYVWLAALIGFPIALIFSWRYDVTAAGIRRTPLAPDQAPEALRLGRADYLLLAGLVVVAGFVAFDLSRRAVDEKLALERAPATRSIEPYSVAVLPLRNLSPDGSDEYFAAGMYDTLINTLCKVSALKVTSGTSASRVDAGLTMPMIGRRLGVAHLIEGSVMREGNRVRIVVQLFEAATDQHVWAESYEREFSDVMTIQADVARAVARAVSVNLTEEDEQQLARSLDIQPPTFEAYLRAMFQFRKETRTGYRRGIEILEQALEDDPTSALAWAGVAQGYAELGHSPFPVRGAYPRARAAAQRALELDDTLAEAHLAQGMYRLYYEYDWAGAERSLDRALQLNPSLSDAWYHRAWQLELFGHDDEALAAGERTIALSPLSPFYASWLGEQYRDARRFERAIELAESVLRFSPDYPVAWLVLGNVYGEQGRFEEAIEAHRNIADSPFWSWALGYTYAMAGREDDARAVLADIEPEQDNALPLTLVHAALGDADDALRWLHELGEAKMPWYPWVLGWFPQFQPLRDHPEVIAEAERLGIPLQRR